jgi:hypothetical protein
VDRAADIGGRKRPSRDGTLRSVIYRHVSGLQLPKGAQPLQKGLATLGVRMTESTTLFPFRRSPTSHRIMTVTRLSRSSGLPVFVTQRHERVPSGGSAPGLSFMDVV